MRNSLLDAPGGMVGSQGRSPWRRPETVGAVCGKRWGPGCSGRDQELESILTPGRHSGTGSELEPTAPRILTAPPVLSFLCWLLVILQLQLLKDQILSSDQHQPIFYCKEAVGSHHLNEFLPKRLRAGRLHNLWGSSIKWKCGVLCWKSSKKALSTVLKYKAFPFFLCSLSSACHDIICYMSL